MNESYGVIIENQSIDFYSLKNRLLFHDSQRLVVRVYMYKNISESMSNPDPVVMKICSKNSCFSYVWAEGGVKTYKTKNIWLSYFLSWVIFRPREPIYRYSYIKLLFTLFLLSNNFNVVLCIKSDVEIPKLLLKWTFWRNSRYVKSFICQQDFNMKLYTMIFFPVRKHMKMVLM